MPAADAPPGPGSGVTRRAGLATALLFGVNGAIFGAIIPRLPQFKDALDLSESQFGLVMAFFPLGALLGGLMTPLLLRGRSDGALAGMTMLLASIITVLLPMAPEAWLFALALGLFGATDAMTDIAMNAHGIRLQVVVRRSIINRFHAVWSAGAVVGALVSSAGLGVGLGILAQFVAIAALCAVLSVVAYSLRLPEGLGDDPRLREVRGVPEAVGGTPAEPSSRRAPLRDIRHVPFAVWIRTVAIGLFALSGVLVEDFAQNWAALYLIEVGAAPLALAGAGFIAVQGAQFVGRLSGDGLVDRFGAPFVARIGGLCVLTGVSTLIIASFVLTGHPFLVVAVGGLALTGWGVATVIPGAMFASDRTPGLPVGVGLSVLNWMLRIGAMVAPPVVGLIAENAGMRWGVLPMVLAGLTILALAGLITKGPHTGQPQGHERGPSVHADTHRSDL